MFRAELPRLYDLKDCISDLNSPNAYFREFDQKLASSAHVKDLYLRWERTLQGLDPNAWEHLKDECRPRLNARSHAGRGWEQLFDILNEARAYNFLRFVGGTEVHFIPRDDEKTPDLECYLSPARVLCEVKSINISDDEAALRIKRVFEKVAPTF
jgi:hypothetical protein